MPKRRDRIELYTAENDAQFHWWTLVAGNGVTLLQSKTLTTVSARNRSARKFAKAYGLTVRKR